jgi:hypothetical protein
MTGGSHFVYNTPPGGAGSSYVVRVSRSAEDGPSSNDVIDFGQESVSISLSFAGEVTRHALGKESGARLLEQLGRVQITAAPSAGVFALADTAPLTCIRTHW